MIKKNHSNQKRSLIRLLRKIRTKRNRKLNQNKQRMSKYACISLFRDIPLIIKIINHYLYRGKMEATKKIPITFITGNKKKLEEFLAIMSDELVHHYTVNNMDVDRKVIWFTYI